MNVSKPILAYPKQMKQSVTWDYVLDVDDLNLLWDGKPLLTPEQRRDVLQRALDVGEWP